MYHKHLRLYIANVNNYFVFHGNLGLVTQVVHFLTLFSYLLISVLKLSSLFIYFISTEYAGIFLMDELTSVSIHLDSVLIGFLFVFWLMRLMMFEETWAASVPVSTKAQHLIPSMLTITKGYVKSVLFVVKRIFSFLSDMEVWCFELQIRHNSLLPQSQALCFVPVQLKKEFNILRVLSCDLLHFLMARTD